MGTTSIINFLTLTVRGLTELREEEGIKVISVDVGTPYVHLTEESFNSLFDKYLVRDNTVSERKLSWHYTIVDGVEFGCIVEKSDENS